MDVSNIVASTDALSPRGRQTRHGKVTSTHVTAEHTCHRKTMPTSNTQSMSYTTSPERLAHAAAQLTQPVMPH